ncbi:hypothetical protein QLH51_14245 [Sphingomonas sp. 2R-10]|uniref:hypothetical protein n=1 Tax=Sphingomonas sp. 2R-10 TaxID=3045148 RepID=UPI000F78059D|nr:hypothetical protein [Sphingomonas sp. 2R-10]MDJ0277959.1 hypothetical protein [Sphingomonas sp. 2R-10]
MPNLVFPRLSRLAIDGYEPYVNEAGPGFDHEFLPGVNVVVGINGLGKTTLLNVIFRMLVGPYDPAKADRDRPGRRQAGLVRDRNFDFFARRSNDFAIEATASATFRFGARTLKVTRSLKDLMLLEYALDGHSTITTVDPEASDAELMDVMAMLMNFDVQAAKDRGSISYRYDYDFVVRNLIFFLEEKVPLIWNPDGQFVILRILLVDEELSEQISKARNDVLQADSQYRNKLWSANKLRQTIKEELNAMPDATKEMEEFGLLVSAVAALEEARDDLLQQREFFSREIGRTEDGLLRTRADAFEAQVSLRGIEAAYFQHAFRKVRAPGDLIMQALSSHEGCLVCGNTSEETYERARRLMEHHQCPVCEADTSIGEDNVEDMADARLDELRKAEKAAEQKRRLVDRLTQTSIDLTAQYRVANDDLQQTLAKLEQARRRERSEAQRAEQIAKVAELKGKLETIDLEVKTLRDHLDGLVEWHKGLVYRSKHFIAERQEAIVGAFREYASAFMVEDCHLVYRTNREARVAQSDEKIDWPAFEVQLASGADSLPTSRDWHTEVSESQKEFIDLAFRMALLRVASEGSASMLAVETPEASLDAFFVEKAGALLRTYAAAHPENILLVTSNLTREHMIAQLLGTPDAEDLETRKRRTLNLLEIARPTKAYRENHAFYDKRYDEAVGEESASVDGETVE